MSSYIYELIRPEEDIPVKCFCQKDISALVPAHWHNSVELLRVERGRLQVILGEAKYFLEPGMFLIINSREIHSTFCGDDICLEVLQVPYPFLKKYMPGQDGMRFYQAPIEQENRAGELLHRLNVMNQERGPGFLLEFHAALFELLYLLQTEYRIPGEASEQEDRDRRRLISVMDYVNQNYREKITLEEAAELVALNKEYFCRFFKKNMGMSLMEYINEVRFSHVCEALAESDAGIMELLEEHGFTNYKLFRKMFRERYHSTPGRRRREKNGNTEADRGKYQRRG